MYFFNGIGLSLHYNDEQTNSMKKPLILFPFSFPIAYTTISVWTAFAPGAESFRVFKEKLRSFCCRLLPYTYSTSQEVTGGRQTIAHEVAHKKKVYNASFVCKQINNLLGVCFIKHILIANCYLIA